MDYSPAGSSVHGIFQARILDWVAISYSRDLSDPEIETVSLASPALADGFFTIRATQEYTDVCYWVGPKVHSRVSKRYHIKPTVLA